ncbi:MAG: hypothetical protein L3J93_06670, partial [Thermoplasmata archaeon]|nr:hypothetical protein [Thermoplasmata archaeon]
AAISGIEKAIPRHGSAEARKLSDRIQAAKRRGEEVGEATAEFDRLLDALRRREVFDIAARLVETRRSVGRIAIEPTLSLRTSDEEEEILLEARILARRIHRIKRNVRDAQSAARLMSHVRAALSEDRRYGTPQDEIDQLWDEVARLTRDRGPAETPPPETPETPGPPAPKEEETPGSLPVDAVAPPEPPAAEESASPADPPPKRREAGRNA